MKLIHNLSAICATALVLAACAPAATPAPKPTEAPKPTAAPTQAPAPTAAPKPTDVPKPTEAPKPTDVPKPTEVPATATPAAPKPLVVDKAKLTKQLNIYSWSNYFKDSLVKAFEKEYGVKVKIDTYEQNEEMYAKFKAGGNPGYDIIVPTDYMAAKMIKEGLVEKMNYENIPNIANVDPALRALNYDPKGENVIPYFWGTTGFAYDTSKVKRELTSWKDVLEPEKDLQGRVAMLADPREALSAALRHKGYSANTNDAKQIEEAKKILIDQKKSVKAYQDSPENAKLLVNGQVWVAQVYTGDAIQVMREKPTLKYVVPNDVTTIWVDNIAIPKGVKNRYTAEVFINYMLDAKIGGENANETGAPSSNQAAVKGNFIDKDLLGNPAVYVDVAKMGKKLELLEVQDAKTEELFDKAWTEIGVK